MGKDLVKSEQTFLFCDGGSCQKAGGENVVREARAYLRNNGLWNKTHTIKTRCNGRCEDAPTCIVADGDYWYKELTPSKIKEVVASHVNENKPVEDYLLYKDGDAVMQSENERPVITPKDFVLKEDDELGTCYITKGFNSDQYSYPLFTYLLEQNIEAQITFAGNQIYRVNDLISVVYETAYFIDLEFQNNSKQRLTIGSIPKHEEQSIIQSKISSSEYFISQDKLKRGIRFKDKMGKFVALLEIDKSDTLFWDYCLNIQLLGKQDPTKVLEQNNVNS